MSTKKTKYLWDVTYRPHTRAKLGMLRDIFNIWLTIWNGRRQQQWVDKEWYIIDLFAGRGWYTNKEKEVSGSPLIFLEEILSKERKLKNNEVKIKLFFFEKTKKIFNELKERVDNFLKAHPEIKDNIELKFYYADCNKKTEEIIEEIINNSQNPLFLFVDPYGINIHKETIKKYLTLNNPIDIFFNYSKEGETRTRGIAVRPLINQKEIKTVNSLQEFLGKDVDYKTKKDLNLLKEYGETLFVDKGYHVVGFDMEYPNRKDIIYYLLFASKNETVTNRIVKNIYAKYKEEMSEPVLFGKDFYLNTILSISPKIRGIKRKSLLYMTKVEYGNWTINHIVGCMHGCKFPCYAMMMAKKFGWIKDYNDWRKPRIVTNALELLEKEIPKYKKQIDFVHLSFMSDPFMYDSEKGTLIPEIKDLTLNIIERLNKEDIKVTILTKGFYPDEILNDSFLKDNEYGITLVSLNNKFKQEFEPFSSSYEKRIDSLRKLHDAGLKTWVSIEPYPTPNLDETAVNIENILEKIIFVDKIIFGKLNYNVNSSKFYNNYCFYEEIAKKVINFCKENKIKYHIKLGTPYSDVKTKKIFKEKNDE